MTFPSFLFLIAVSALTNSIAWRSSQWSLEGRVSPCSKSAKSKSEVGGIDGDEEVIDIALDQGRARRVEGTGEVVATCSIGPSLFREYGKREQPKQQPNLCVAGFFISSSLD